ncbi:hypothetical protein FB451DRAFT_1217148, partial [Mycena latifolia]
MLPILILVLHLLTFRYIGLGDFLRTEKTLPPQLSRRSSATSFPVPQKQYPSTQRVVLNCRGAPMPRGPKRGAPQLIRPAPTNKNS